MAVNAHQPPERGERGDGIMSQCYEAIEHRIDMEPLVSRGRRIDRSLDQVPRSYLR